MPQTRSFMTNQAHSVSYETKAFTEVTFSEHDVQLRKRRRQADQE
jgi:hypothetical protein